MCPGHQRHRAQAPGRGQTGRGQERRGQDLHGEGKESRGRKGTADGARHDQDDGQDEAAGGGEQEDQVHNDGDGASDRETAGRQN